MRIANETSQSALDSANDGCPSEQCHSGLLNGGSARHSTREASGLEDAKQKINICKAVGQ